MADVSSNLYSWSTTASSNSPSGSTNIGTGLDDNLREIQKVIRQDLANAATDVASATTTDLGAVASNYVRITGTTTITGLGTVSAGIWKVVRFAAALTLTHNATSLILPGAASILTAAGDMAMFVSEGSGNWRCVYYFQASGNSLQGAPIGAQGRITLTTATAVTTSDVTGATTVYFTPYKGNKVELYDGATWVLYPFTELSQATSDSTKSPAAVTTNSNYDLFVWNDSGTLRCTCGPAWSSDTARGTGAGTTELELLTGRYVNKVAITNGPSAQRGLYVGTIRSDGSSQINDAVAKRHVWNQYNRMSRTMRALDSTNSWTYTTATWRQANNAAANQLDYVVGLIEDAVQATVFSASFNSSANVSRQVGIGVDSTTADSSQIRLNAQTQTAGEIEQMIVEYQGWPGIGRHYLAWIETSVATGTTTWIGDNVTSNWLCGIFGKVMA